MSKDVILLAYEKGYRTLDDGTITGIFTDSLAPHVGANGYPLFVIRDGTKTKSVPAHRFAAYCYFGDELFKHECVRHKNGIKSDISRDNLTLGSLSDNFQDIAEQWREDFSMKGAKARRKLSESDVREIRKRIEEGEILRTIAEDFEVARSTIQQILEGKSYKWVK